MAFKYTNPTDPYPDFSTLLSSKKACPPALPIPKIAHFIHADVDAELTWLDWAAVRGAVANLRVEEVHVWIPEGAELKGWVWNRVMAMGEVRMRRVVLPKKVWGKGVRKGERRAEVAKLKVLWEEGGIFLDTDLVPLKSSDDVIYGNATRATVMARQFRGHGLPNGMIMSKPRSPFIKRLIQEYKDLENDKQWDELSATRPWQMWREQDPDLTVLDGHAWFYPLSAEKDGDATLKQLWFGKSWWDVEKSYGTHFWHPTAKFAELVTPKVVRTIDTPLFCATRKLFDDVDGDGYFAKDPKEDPNCAVTWARDLEEENHRMFADYQMATDEEDIKWMDSSGFNHHGWAPAGTERTYNETTGTVSRTISEGSYAVLPVPVDFDARVWSARIKFETDPLAISEGEGVGLFKIRMETGGEILVRIRNDNPFPGTTVKVEWKGNQLAKKEYQTLDDLAWVSQAGLDDLSLPGPHELAITYDRKTTGAINLYLNTHLLANKTLPTIASPKIAQEIWFNAREWNNLDTNFRGTLSRLTLYASALPPASIAAAIPSTSTMAKLRTISIPSTASSSPFAFFLPLTVLLLLTLYLLRRKKFWMTAIPAYASTALPTLLATASTKLSVFLARLRDYIRTEILPQARRLPDRALDLADRVPWLKEGVPWLREWVTWLGRQEPSYAVAATEEEGEGEEEGDDSKVGRREERPRGPEEMEMETAEFAQAGQMAEQQQPEPSPKKSRAQLEQLSG